MLKRSVGLFFAFLLLVFSCFAAEPQQVIMWPSAGTPVLQFTFSKFRDLGGSVGSQRPFATDTTAKNLSSQLIPHERFTLYVFDRKQIRIGDASMEVSNIGPGETVKFQVTIMTSGSPATLSIAADSDAAKKVSLTINSVPQGALLKVDDVEAGTTPRLISIGPGKHRLSFSKDGFRSGEFPLEIGPNDVSGGSVSYELGAAQFDTIELRDGTVLNGDLDSIAGMEVVVRVGGTLQQIDRNKVSRILLVERDAPEPSSLPPAAPK
ncbi:MAG: PEGA domain-containing protein [Terracidiphilus sp.]|jgi:hypothetical protein